MWCEANRLAREWANVVQDLPLPVFQGQLAAMRKVIESAKGNAAPLIGTYIFKYR